MSLIRLFVDRRACWLALGVLLLPTPETLAADYRFSDLYPLIVPSGYTGRANDVVAPGVTVGYAATGPFSVLGDAIVWSATGAPTLLPTGGVVPSTAIGISGTQIVGQIGTSDAVIWNGAHLTYVDLNPGAGDFTSTALATDGSQQVGVVRAGGLPRAALWNQTATSWTDLGPLGFDSSEARGTDGVHQIGTARDTVLHSHALLWSGRSDSFVDLTPTAYVNAYGMGIGGNQEVGYGDVPTQVLDYLPQHALLWNGSSRSYVDLNPEGFLNSIALATNGVRQIGEASNGIPASGPDDVFVWSGTAASGIDLSGLLPGGWSSANGTSIDSSGNVFGYAQDPSGIEQAVEWVTAIPEPSVAPALMVALAAASRRRHARSSAVRLRSAE